MAHPVTHFEIHGQDRERLHDFYQRVFGWSIDDRHPTGWLLVGGAVAAPLWFGVVVVQMLTRPGFDLRRHAISVLDLGDLGWVQVTNFVVAGLLMVACAAGLRRALRSGPAATWGPLL